MKKWMMIFACIALFVFATGCKSEDAGAETKTEENKAQTEMVEASSDQDISETTGNDLIPDICKVPMNEIYLNVPSYVVLEEGYSNIYWDNGVKYVAFTCQYEDTSEALSDAYDQTCHKFMINVHDNHCVNEIDKVTKEEVTVNGIDTIRLQGTANCGRETLCDAYIYGYAFIINGHPCSIIGVVKDVSQPQEEIDSVTELVDAMMMTVRTEP